MADTFQLIASSVLSSDQSSVALTNLPTTYTDYMIFMSVRMTSSNDSDGYYFNMQNNGGGTNNFGAATHIYGAGGSASGSTAGYNGWAPSGTSGTTALVNESWFYLSGVQNGNTNISVIGQSVSITTSLSPTGMASISTSPYATSIKGVTFIPSTSFGSGSGFWIYGITAA